MKKAGFVIFISGIVIFLVVAFYAIWNLDFRSTSKYFSGANYDFSEKEFWPKYHSYAELGAAIKLKNPQFADVSDEEVAQRAIAARPELQKLIIQTKIRPIGQQAKSLNSLKNQLSYWRPYIRMVNEANDGVVELLDTLTCIPKTALDCSSGQCRDISPKGFLVISTTDIKTWHTSSTTPFVYYCDENDCYFRSQFISEIRNNKKYMTRSGAGIDIELDVDSNRFKASFAYGKNIESGQCYYRDSLGI